MGNGCREQYRELAYTCWGVKGVRTLPTNCSGKKKNVKAMCISWHSKTKVKGPTMTALTNFFFF